MNLKIPIELIYKIMYHMEPRSLILISMTCKELHNEINNNYRKYFNRYRKIYPDIFYQKVYNEIIFKNNCMLNYFDELRF